MSRPKKAAVKQPPAPWCGSVAGFAAYLEAERRPDQTRKAYAGDLASFQAWYVATVKEELCDVGQATARALRQWQDDLQRGEAAAFRTINRRLSGVASFLKWAYYQGLIPRLVDPPKRIKGPRGKPRWLTRKEKNALLDAVEHAPSRDRAVIVLLLNSGLRVSELSALKWPDVFLQERKGKLRVRYGKGGKVREVQVNPDCRAALMLLGWETKRGTDGHVVVGERRGQLGPRGIQGLAERYGKAAGIEGFSAHKLRHTFAHDLLETGSDLVRVAAILGHSSLDTTRLYVEPSEDDLQRDVDRLSGRVDRAAMSGRNGKNRS
jgi:integrase/recombinase XerC